MSDVPTAAAHAVTVCADPSGCCALPADGSSLCNVHLSVAVRALGDVPIRCYACGEAIRLVSRWVVRAEGAFHNRFACLSTPPDQQNISKATLATYRNFGDAARAASVTPGTRRGVAQESHV